MVGYWRPCLCVLLIGLGMGSRPAWAGEPASWLPRYDLDIRLDTGRCVGQVIERVTWTNPADHAIREIVFNAHAHYEIPSDEIGKLAKIVEILRMSPSEAMSFDGPALDVERVYLME